MASPSPSAEWAQPFDPGATTLREFFLDERRAVQVPMRRQKARHRFLHDPELQCTALQMDHAGNATTFFVFPRPSKLAQVEEALLPESLIKWDGLLRTRWAAPSGQRACLPAQTPGRCHPMAPPLPGPVTAHSTATLGRVAPRPDSVTSR